MRKRYLVVIAACLVPVLGSSCSSQPPPIPATGHSVLVIYERSGGLAGLRDHLTIYSDGHCELQRKGVELEFTLETDEVERLTDIIEEANIPALKGSYLPGSTGADLFEYAVSYQPETGKMHTVRATNGAVPDALQPVLHELNRIITSNS